MGLLLLYGASPSGTGSAGFASATFSAYDATVSTATGGQSVSVNAGFASFTMSAGQSGAGQATPLAQFVNSDWNAYDAIVSTVTPVGAQVVLTDSIAIQVALSDFA